MAAAIATGLGLSAAVAADEPQVVRQEMMKKVGGAMGAIGAIVKGEKPFDAEVVKASLTTMVDVSKAFPDQFPAGSELGMDTEASLKIWEDMDGFKAKAAALTTAAEAQLAQLPTDQASTAVTMKAVGETCGACHKAYRLKK
ncbi:cytochrome C556 [Ciceribacter naphthalenivorans]|nr:cytochrome C556 [Ciceribacter naphthalenivorans]GLT07686.1 cytochrome C556 [Sphingomonas psychrolutea]